MMKCECKIIYMVIKHILLDYIVQNYGCEHIGAKFIELQNLKS
jgi:hypothetical protein